MPPWKNYENPDKITIQNTVDSWTKKSLIDISNKFDYLVKLKGALEKTFADLDAQTKLELQTKYFAELKKVKFFDL